ncbi:hypothetical protein [Achromobacter phage ewik_TL4]|nr:hypothetical protein [Achromobacter phage hasilly_LB3]WNO48773.1 hypothetical protein [Achromobacter phage nyaak_TL1]WNO48966.1 hypothetical protein [Achromobacter phage ewii_LB8]WNO49252.1 hypothetical protein [Achromobacter phage ewik_TL4]WOZ53375.1 hypothetical protein [Achromobacter phage tuull]
MLLSSHYAIDSRLSEASRQHVSPASPKRYRRSNRRRRRRRRRHGLLGKSKYVHI